MFTLAVAGLIGVSGTVSLVRLIGKVLLGEYPERAGGRSYFAASSYGAGNAKIGFEVYRNVG